MLGFPLGILSAAGAGGAAVSGAYELISTTVLGGTAASVTFSNLGDYSSTYKHLQIRAVARDNANAAGNLTYVRINGDTGNNYTGHYLDGTGSSVLSDRIAETNQFHGIINAGDLATANSFAASVIDFLDAFSTTKNKTARIMTGRGDRIRFYSGLYISTASTTSITLTPNSASFVAGSRFSLYGIKG